MNFKEWFFNESNVNQELKKVPENVLTELKKSSDHIFNNLFNFEIDEKKKKEIKDWIAFNLQKNKDLETILKEHIDFLITQFNTINFKDTGYTVEKFIQDSNKYHDDLKNNTKVGSKGAYGKVLISFPDGWKWLDLEKGYCGIEGASMGHCGNVAGQMNRDHNIFSLRNPQNVPYLTFVDNGDGVLGEMKGRFNNKPEKKFHPYILALLKHPRINKIKGGGYLPENNFQISDLSDKDKKDLDEVKPFIVITPDDIIRKKLRPANIYMSGDYKVEELLDSMVHYGLIHADGTLDTKKTNEIIRNSFHFNYDELFDAIKDDYEVSYPQKIADSLLKNNIKIKNPLLKDLIEKMVETDANNNDATRPIYEVGGDTLLTLYQKQTDVFDTIFNKISLREKSNFVKRAVFKKIKLSDKLYDYLTFYDLYAITKSTTEPEKLPPYLKIVISRFEDYSKISDEEFVQAKSIVGKGIINAFRRMSRLIEYDPKASQKRKYDINLQYRNALLQPTIPVKQIPYQVAVSALYDQAFPQFAEEKSWIDSDDKQEAYKLLNYFKINYKPIKQIVNLLKKYQIEYNTIASELSEIMKMCGYLAGGVSPDSIDSSTKNVLLNLIEFYVEKYPNTNKSSELDSTLISLAQKYIQPNPRLQKLIDKIKFSKVD